MRGYGIAEYRVRMIRAAESEAVDKFKASLIGVSTIVSITSQRQLVAEAEATTALRQENERLRAALEEIATEVSENEDNTHRCISIARAALETSR
jgi:regulator of replication initiation timing